VRNQLATRFVNALFARKNTFPGIGPSFDCQNHPPTLSLNLFSITPAINSGATGGTKP
jgi:hypothetical protein